VRIVVEQSGHWLYPVFWIAAFGLAGSVIIGARRVRLGHARRLARPENTPFVVTAITSSVTLFFCAQNMFFRFHAVEPKADKLTLAFCWPRPSASILKSDFDRVEIFRDRRGSGHIKLFTKNGSLQSIGFTRKFNAEAIKASLDAWTNGSPP
jgi:hypothetical protein